MSIDKAEKATRAAYPDWRTAAATNGVTGAATPQKGAEQIIATGANKGRKAVFDGKGWVLRGGSLEAPPVAPSTAVSGAAPAVAPTPAAMAAKVGTPPGKSFYGEEATNERMAKKAAELEAKNQSDAIKAAQAKVEQDKANADMEKMRQWRLANVGDTSRNTLLNVNFQGRP